MKKKRVFSFIYSKALYVNRKDMKKVRAIKVYTLQKKSAFPCVSHVVTVYTGYGKVKIECRLGSVGTLHTKKSRKNLVYKQNGSCLIWWFFINHQIIYFFFVFCVLETVAFFAFDCEGCSAGFANEVF